MPAVLVTGEHVQSDDLQQLEAAGLELRRFTRTLTLDELLDALSGCEYYLYGGEEPADTLTFEQFEELRRGGLRLIAFAGKGVNAWLDVSAAVRAGILVSNTPGPVEEAVAEFTIGLIIDGVRGISRHVVRSTSPTTSLTSGVSSQVIGIIGMGDIGQAVAQRLTGLGCEVIYWSRTRRPAVEDSFGIQYRDLETVISASDVVTLHLASNDETKGLVAALPLEEASGLMLVNAAHQDLLNADRLFHLLRSGAVREAWFDGSYPEATLESSHLDGLVGSQYWSTGHVANLTSDAWTGMVRMAARAIIACHDAEEPVPNLVEADA